MILEVLAFLGAEGQIISPQTSLITTAGAIVLAAIGLQQARQARKAGASSIQEAEVENRITQRVGAARAETDSALAAQRGLIEALSHNNDSNNETIGRLREDNAALRAEVSTLRSEIVRHEDLARRCEADRAVLLGRVDELSTRVRQLEGM